MFAAEEGVGIDEEDDDDVVVGATIGCLLVVMFAVEEGGSIDEEDDDVVVVLCVACRCPRSDCSVGRLV